jgi:hypothetical protein
MTGACTARTGQPSKPLPGDGGHPVVAGHDLVAVRLFVCGVCGADLSGLKLRQPRGARAMTGLRHLKAVPFYRLYR